MTLHERQNINFFFLLFPQTLEESESLMNIYFLIKPKSLEERLWKLRGGPVWFHESATTSSSGDSERAFNLSIMSYIE